MYLLRRLYRGLRYAIAGVGIVAGGGVLAYATLSLSPIFMAGGGLYFVTSVLLIIDTAKVIHDVELEFNLLQNDHSVLISTQRELSQLRVESASSCKLNQALCNQIATLVESEYKLERENTTLAVQINTIKRQITQMEGTRKRYEMEIQRVRLQSVGNNHDSKLVESAKAAASTYAVLKRENAELQSALTTAKAQILFIDTIKAEHEAETLKYRDLLVVNSYRGSKIVELTAALDKQNIALCNLRNRTKGLVCTLLEAGEVFNTFTSTTEDRAALQRVLQPSDLTNTEIENASDELSSLVDRLNQHLSVGTEKTVVNVPLP